MFSSKTFFALILSATLLPLTTIAQQPNNQPESTWKSFVRTWRKPLAFLMGALALGSVAYAGSKNSDHAEKAVYSAWGALIGGLCAQSYTDNEKRLPYVYKGSLSAAAGFSLATAGLGLAGAHIAQGTGNFGLVSVLGGWAVGRGMYYSQKPTEVRE